MVIDSKILDELTAQAQSSPRLRIHYDMRTTPADGSQRMLNALEPGTVLQIHRNLATSGTVVILRGSARQYFYDDNGNVDEVVTITTSSDSLAMNVEKARWHRIESLESGTVILECKDGANKSLGEDEFFINVLQQRIARIRERLLTPEYIFRLWSGQVPLDLIEEAMKGI